jgi:hypothetical protein
VCFLNQRNIVHHLKKSLARKGLKRQSRFVQRVRIRSIPGSTDLKKSRGVRKGRERMRKEVNTSKCPFFCTPLFPCKIHKLVVFNTYYSSCLQSSAIIYSKNTWNADMTWQLHLGNEKLSPGKFKLPRVLFIFKYIFIV